MATASSILKLLFKTLYISIAYTKLHSSCVNFCCLTDRARDKKDESKGNGGDGRVYERVVS